MFVENRKIQACILCTVFDEVIFENLWFYGFLSMFVENKKIQARKKQIDIGPAKSFHSPSLPLPFPSPFLSIYLPSSPFNLSLSLPFPSSPSKLSLPLEPGRLKYS